MYKRIYIYIYRRIYIYIYIYICSTYCCTISKKKLTNPVSPTFYSRFKESFNGKYHVYIYNPTQTNFQSIVYIYKY